MLPLSAWELTQVQAHWTLEAFGYLALLVVAASFWGLPGLRHGAARAWRGARTGIIMYLGPVYAALLAWALLGEPLRMFHAVGAVLVLGGVLRGQSPHVTGVQTREASMYLPKHFEQQDQAMALEGDARLQLCDPGRQLTTPVRLLPATCR